MSEQNQEYKNENLSVVVTREPGCHLKLDISVFPKATEAAFAKAVKIVNKEITLPGFRKGKAPESLVFQHYGNYVNQEFRDIVLQTAFQEALQAIKVFPLNDNSVKRPQIKSCSKEEGAKITVEFEAQPQIPDLNPAELKLKKVKKKEVTEKEVDKAIEDIRHHHAEWIPITDRPVQEGDFVDLDIDAIDNPAQNICSNQRFEVRKGEMGDWMRTLIVGKNVDDSVEGMSEKDTHHHHHDHEHTENCDHESHKHEKEFKPRHCRIVIKAIQKPNLPEINEDLAKKVGTTSVPQMRERIKANLEKQAENAMRQKLRGQVEELLLEKYDFDLPTSLLDGEKKASLSNRMKVLRKQKESEDSLAKRKEEIEAEAFKEAHENLKLFFISRKIADQNHISVSQEEIYKELSKQMWGMPGEESVIDPTMDPEEIRSRLYLVVLSEKALDYLVDHASIS